MRIVDLASEPREKWRDGVLTRMRVSAANGGTQLCLFEQWCEPGHGAPTHLHAVEEVLHVLEGEADVWVGERHETLKPGQLMIVPAGIKHGFANSGTGTLRKNPEIRYRVRPAGIEKLARLQARALIAAADLLAPGGYLLYATCSLEEEENERVVEEVLAKRPGLSPMPIEPPEPLREFCEGARFRLLPDARTDGFTAHLLKR